MHTSTQHRRGSAAAKSVRAAGLPARTLRIIGHALRAYFSDSVSRLGAALAFYITLAVSPLLVITIAIAGTVFHHDQARQRVLHELAALAGPALPKALETVQPPMANRTGTLATVIGLAARLYGALNVFLHLQAALNSIWRTSPSVHEKWGSLIRARLLSLATVLMTGFLLLISLVISTVLTWVSGRMAVRLGWPGAALHALDYASSFAVVSVLFALMFKLLPDRRVAWRHVWLGAAVTALLFAIGKGVLGIYLTNARVTSTYGAAGSLVALLLWCYYAAQIFFLGAEFTRITALSDAGRDFRFLSDSAQRRRTA